MEGLNYKIKAYLERGPWSEQSPFLTAEKYNLSIFRSRSPSTFIKQ